jgi:hypothetical protein
LRGRDHSGQSRSTTGGDCYAPEELAPRHSSETSGSVPSLRKRTRFIGHINFPNCQLLRSTSSERIATGQLRTGQNCTVFSPDS